MEERRSPFHVFGFYVGAVFDQDLGNSWLVSMGRSMEWRGSPVFILIRCIRRLRELKAAPDFVLADPPRTGLGRAVGNSASAANWSTSDRMLSTEEVMTSLQRRITPTEGGSGAP